jgi:hypothetical protein
MFGDMAPFGLVACGIIFGFTLGPIFNYAMIALAYGYILYSTSNTLQHYHSGQHVRPPWPCLPPRPCFSGIFCSYSCREISQVNDHLQSRWLEEGP